MSSEFIKQINDAIGAHGAWKLKLKTAIATQRCESDPASVRCDDRCPLGRWLHGGSIDPTTRLGMPYKVVRRLHAEFHESAADVLEQALAGRAQAAQTLMDGPYVERSEKLVRALSKWKGELMATTRAPLAAAAR